MDYDLNLVIPDKGLTLNNGAIDPWNRPKYRTWFTDLRKQAAELGVPWMCHGENCLRQRGKQCCEARAVSSACIGFFAQMERKKYKLHVRVMLSKYRGYAECPDCRGQRLRAEARSVRLKA